MVRKSFLVITIFAMSWARAQQTATQPVALTIYNQDFAVARTSIDLDLHPGINDVTATEVTSKLEPDSVILRDPAGNRTIHVVEQNYDAAVVSQEWLLEKYEGKTIDFQVNGPQGTRIVQGKIIRAGFDRPTEVTYDEQTMPGQQAAPLVEVEGKMQFQLPGLPLFPAATDGLLLKPTLHWLIQAEKPERFTAELAYITGGFDWEATYNVVAPESNDVTGDEHTDVVGWVTIHNQSGTEFPQARIKLMAGDVAKIAGARMPNMMVSEAVIVNQEADVEAPRVTQKPFDDFHLYDLNRTVALRNGETKQVQFIDAFGVTMRRSYLYDGCSVDLQRNYGGGINEQRGYGLEGNKTKVFMVEQIKNSESNHLGIPLPAGRIRLYRRDSDGQMEFVGESVMNHTPTEETIKILTGSAFDVKGSRRQTDFHVDSSDRLLDEAFAITLTNQKQQPVHVTVVEHLYRAANWEIREKSADFNKRDSNTIEFPLEVPAKGEATLTYSVRYSW